MSARAPRKPGRAAGRRPTVDARGRFARTLFLLTLAAFALRFIYLAGASADPLYRHPALDARVNDEQAWSLARGDAEPREPYFRPPLYATFLASIYRVAGHDLRAPRVVQAALGVGTVILIGLLGASMWDRRVGVVAAALAAAYGPAIYFEGELVSASLELFLAVLTLWLLVEGVRRRAPAWLCGAGLALAASAVTRPTVLPFALGAGAWLWWRRVPGKTVALYAAAVLSLPVAVTLRNVAVSGDPVLIASQGGINFYIGNHAGADGTTPAVPGLGAGVTSTYDAPFREASRQAGRTLRASEVSAFWFGKGIEFWRDASGAGAALTARKVAMVWNRRELPNTQDQAFFAPFHSWVFRGPFLLSFAFLAPVGLAAAWFERKRAALLLWFAGALTAATAAFFVCDRFRLPLAAALIPLAAAGLVRVWDAWRATRAASPSGSATPGGVLALGKRAIAPVALVLAAGAFVWLPFPRWQATEEGMSWFRLATAYEQAHDAPDAARAYERAGQAGLDTPEYWNNYGLFALRAGDLAAAKQRFEKAIALHASHGAALGNLAEVFRRQGAWSDAAGAYAAAAGAMPDHAAELLTNAGAAYERAGDRERARMAYERALVKRPGFEPAAAALRALGAPAGAARNGGGR